MFRGVDLNCGCPSVESGGAATYGASLMRRPELTEELASAVRGAVDESWSGRVSAAGRRVEVSVKTRIAAFDSPEEMAEAPPDLGEARYAALRDYVERVESGGADHVILHARPAVLSGLSPSKNRVVPSINYEFVERAAADFPAMRVTMNGGISSLSDLKSVLSTDARLNEPGRVEASVGHVASHMAGRWMLRRPLDLAVVQSRYLDVGGDAVAEEVPVTLAVQRYIEYVERAFASKAVACPTTSELLLPLYLVVEQLREDYDVYFDSDEGNNDGGIGYDEDRSVAALISAEDMEMIYETVVDALGWMEDGSGSGGGKRKKSKIPSRDAYNFKKLAASFKKIVGTKVANKWKRNRAEL